jgi:hypothetical protein
MKVVVLQSVLAVTMLWVYTGLVLQQLDARAACSLSLLASALGGLVELRDFVFFYSHGHGDAKLANLHHILSPGLLKKIDS